MATTNGLSLSGLLLIVSGLASFAGAYLNHQPDLYGAGAALIGIGSLLVALGADRSKRST